MWSAIGQRIWTDIVFFVHSAPRQCYTKHGLKFYPYDDDNQLYLGIKPVNVNTCKTNVLKMNDDKTEFIILLLKVP